MSKSSAWRCLADPLTSSRADARISILIEWCARSASWLPPSRESGSAQLELLNRARREFPCAAAAPRSCQAPARALPKPQYRVTERQREPRRVAALDRRFGSTVLDLPRAASRSPIQILISDWRGTPSLSASKSSLESIHSGKSTLTRLAASPGRTAFARSRTEEISLPSSKILSSSSGAKRLGFSFRTSAVSDRAFRSIHWTAWLGHIVTLLRCGRVC